MFQWAIRAKAQQNECRHSLIVADYNPTVLQLVTLPNLILSWAVVEKSRVPALQDAFASDDELELTPEVLESFQSSLLEKQISLSFLSGAWSPELVDMIYEPFSTEKTSTLTLLLGAETIYSPFALAAFTETMFSILERERKQGGNNQATAYIAAKRLYFGVGGSLDDFVHVAQSRGGLIDHLREETEGVRRGVVRCSLAGTENTT
jgi:protein-histidine N-methyltransferase